MINIKSIFFIALLSLFACFCNGCPISKITRNNASSLEISISKSTISDSTHNILHEISDKKIKIIEKEKSTQIELYRNDLFLIKYNIRYLFKRPKKSYSKCLFIQSFFEVLDAKNNKSIYYHETSHADCLYSSYSELKELYIDKVDTFLIFSNLDKKYKLKLYLNLIIKKIHEN